MNSAIRFPRLYAAASLKRLHREHPAVEPVAFSAALCRGLIEARWSDVTAPVARPGFPRLYAAASLKHSDLRRAHRQLPVFSAALCRGLIEATSPRWRTPTARRRFSAALCRGLIEAPAPGSPSAGAGWRSFPRLYAAASLKPGDRHHPPDECTGFPRLYAAASLKRHGGDDGDHVSHLFSAALCRGLIEAWRPSSRPAEDKKAMFSAALCRGLIEARTMVSVPIPTRARFPRLYAAASLKQLGELRLQTGNLHVFRGSMPRPH